MNIDGTSKILTTGKGMLGKLSRFHEINMNTVIMRSVGQSVSRSASDSVSQKSNRQSVRQSVGRSVGR